MLKQLKDLLAQPPSQDLVPVVDMLSGEAGTLVQELQGKVEVCMGLEQFDLVEQIIGSASELEDLQRRAERWKASAASGGGQRPGVSPAASASGVSPAASQGTGAASFGPAGPAATGLLSQGSSSPGAGGRVSSGSAAAGAQTPESVRRRVEEEAELGRRRMEEALQLSGVGTGRSAISEAQARQDEARRQQAEEDRFGTFQSVDDRLPSQSSLGGLPAFGSSSGRRAQGTPSSRSIGGTPLSRPQEQRRNEARQTLRTTLEGSMREDATVLQWALSEAQLAGVADLDPALVSEGERALERVQSGQREQSALEQLRAALEASPRSAEALREAVDEAAAAGLTPAQVEPALEALRLEEERGKSPADEQRKVKEAEEAAEERKRREAEKQAEALRAKRLKELREAAHSGEPDRLVRAIDLARSAGVAEVAIKSAEANLMAMRFVGGKLARTPILQAWRSHVAHLRSSRQALKEAIHDGVGADELEEAIDAASEAGVDETTCDMARTVASHRRSAHDLAACALTSMDLEELHEAKAQNEAAGGPKMDVGHLTHAIAQAEEDAKMVRSWDTGGLPDAVDMYFKQLELEQQEAKARIARASSSKLAPEDGGKVGTPLAAASPLGRASPPASEKTPKAQRSPLALPVPSQRLLSQDLPQLPATSPIRLQGQEEWKREYMAIVKAEQARRMQEQQLQRNGELVPDFYEAEMQKWAQGSPLTAKDIRRTSPISRRRHVCGPPPEDTESDLGTPSQQQPQSQVPRSLPSRRRKVCGPGGEDDLQAAQTQTTPTAMSTQAAQTQTSPTAMRSQSPSQAQAAMRAQAAQTQTSPVALRGQSPSQAQAAMRAKSPSRVLPSRRRHICGADGDGDSSAATPRTEAFPSTAPAPSQDRRTPPPSRVQQEALGQYRSPAARPIDQTQVWQGTPSQRRILEDDLLAGQTQMPAAMMRTQSPSQTLAARRTQSPSRVLPSRRHHCCGEESEADSAASMPRTEALPSTAPPPSQDRRTPLSSQAPLGGQHPGAAAAPPLQDLLAQYPGAAARPVDQTQVWLDAPGQGRSMLGMPLEERMVALKQAPANVASAARDEERMAALKLLAANPSAGLLNVRSPMETARSPGEGSAAPLRTRSPVQTARSLVQSARSLMPAATSPAPRARSPAQAGPPRGQRMLYARDVEEDALPVALPPATAPAVEPKVQASRNMPSRYKTGHPTAEDLSRAPLHAQQSAQVKQSRPVLLGQQQPPACALPYSASGLPYEEQPLDYGYPAAALTAPMVPGADVVGGTGYNYSGYEEMRGASTFHDMMANAARMARKPEAEPRRNYEDPTFWR